MEQSVSKLPKEWEEKWKKEKERQKKLEEEGGEGIEAENRKLRWIVAYNSRTMGVGASKVKTAKWRNDKGGSGLEEHEEGKEEDDDEPGDDERDEVMHVCCGATHITKMFQSLREFRESSVLTELTLIAADGRSLCAHFCVMAAVSSVLRQYLQHWHEGQGAPTQGQDAGFTFSYTGTQAALTLGPDVDFSGLGGVVEFAYTGAILGLNELSTAQIQAAALDLGVPRVLKLCKEQEEKGKLAAQAKQKEKSTSPESELKVTHQCICQLWTDKVGCDVELEVKDRTFQAHKVILAVCSDYFRGMFTSGMRESHQPTVVLPSLGCMELDTLVQCSYTGVLPLSWGSVFQITGTALQLQMQPGLSLCFHFLQQKTDANSCLDVASFAEAYGLLDLQELAEDFVLTHFQEVADTPKFLDLHPEKLLRYVQCDSLCVPSELAVFRAVVAWIEADPKERLGLAKELMRGVRFPLMTFREFREVRAINLRMECTGDREVELYCTALEEFGFGSSSSLERSRVRHPKDTLVVLGGDQLDPDFGQRRPSKQLWFINSLRNRTGLVKEVEWRLLGEMPGSARFRHGVAVLGSHLYVAGGCHYYAKADTLKCVYRYDPIQNSWQRLADMLECRSNYSLVVRGKQLYAIGGDREIDSNLDSVEYYCPDSNSWSFAHPLDQALSGHAATVWEGEIFISGGFDCKYQCLVSVFLYRPERGTTYLRNMSHDRAQHCMENLASRFYVAGGVCNLRRFYTDQLVCESYDPLKDTWSSIPALSVAHVSAASAVLEGKLYILGGYCQEDYSEAALVHRYEPAGLRWENMGRMPGPNTDIRACLLHLPPHLRR